MLLNWKCIYILKYESPIITSPDSDIAPLKTTFDGVFIESLWNSLMGIWISNFYAFITSPVIWFLMLIWSFVKGELKTIDDYKSNSAICQFSILKYPLHFFSHLSIHAITFNFFYHASVAFWFYHFCLIVLFETPKILEVDFT